MTEGDKKNFIDLLQRFNALGVQLPSDDVVIDKCTRASAISDAKVLLREMDTVKAQIDKALGLEHRPFLKEN